MTPSKLCSDFMAEYKAMEQALSDAGKTVAEYEQSLSESDRRKLQLCRLTRNFIAHEPAGFAVPTEAMIVFVSGIAQNFHRQKAKICDVMQRVPAAEDKLKIDEIARRLTDKRPAIPIVNSNGVFLGLFTKDSVVDAVSTNCLKLTLSRHKGILVSCVTMLWKEPAEDAPIGCVCAVDEKGRYKGLVFTAPNVLQDKS